VLLLQDVQVAQSDLRSLGNHDGRSVDAGIHGGYVEALIIAFERYDEVTVDEKDPIGGGIYNTK
jgi:hypothetical protein